MEGVLRGMKEIHEELEKDNNGNPIKEDKKIEMNDKELEFPIKNEELDKSLINDQPMGPVIMNKIGSGGKKKRSKKKRYRKKRKTIKKKRRRKKKRSIKFKNY